jgi:chondroitin 4-sulfotransferase 11
VTLISDQLKCIFVEVPKTGSSSIRAIIGEPHRPHLNISQLASLVDPLKFKAYFKFGFVRNPWDRAVSLYERREGMQLRNQMSFEGFIDWMKFASSTCIHPVPHRYQLDWFVDGSGNVLVDFIGRFERLNSDWRLVRTRLGINADLPEINVNPDRPRDYTKYYTDSTKKIVRDRFAVDIEYFGYEFGG